MDKQQIKTIPDNQTVTYARIVVDHCPQKKDPNRLQLTVSGNLINYPGDVATSTADLITTKLFWNSVLSTPGARYVCIDIKNFYLETPMERKEYMCMPAHLIPHEILNKYNMHNKIHNGHIYMEIRRGMYGLPQAGKIANTLFKNALLTTNIVK
eukprot:27847-Ditylum_brightwellii.AAC.1